MNIPDFTLIRLQRELGVEPDGLYGPVTDAALRAEIEQLRMALHRIDDKTRDWDVRKIARDALGGEMMLADIERQELEHLRAEIERLRQQLSDCTKENESVLIYHDKTYTSQKAEIERLQAENEQLKMGLRAIIDDITGAELAKARAACAALEGKK